MSGVPLRDLVIIGLSLEGFFYGLYSAIFALYLGYHLQTSTYNIKIIFCGLCTLYVLSLATVILDITTFIKGIHPTESAVYPLYVVSGAISGCCDFVSQIILIYRCWIVWNRNIRVVMFPLILAFTFLGTWLSPIVSSFHTSPNLIVTTKWGNIGILTACLAISLTANVLVTSLIVLKILRVYSEVKPFYNQTYGPSGGSKLRPIIFVVIESSMTLFSIQLARLVLTIVSTDTAIKISQPIIGMNQMLNGITSTIMQVRVTMGLSFHDQPSLEEVISGLHFGSDPVLPIPDTGTTPDVDVTRSGTANDSGTWFSLSQFPDTIPETGSASIERWETRSRANDIEMNLYKIWVE